MKDNDRPGDIMCQADTAICLPDQNWGRDISGLAVFQAIAKE